MSTKSAPEEYEVEKVIEYRKVPSNSNNINGSGGHDEYLIKWKNYPPSENSWEPESNLNPAALKEARKFKGCLLNTSSDVSTNVASSSADGDVVSMENESDDTTTNNYQYDTLASKVDLHEITSTRQNRRILNRIKQNDVNMTQLFIVEEHDEENRRYDGLDSGNNFVPSVTTANPTSSSSRRRRTRNNNQTNTNNNNTTCSNNCKADDMGWLGYFIGKSHTLQNLHIGSLLKGEEHIEPFWTGIQHNRSISSLRFGGCDLLHGNILEKLHSFFRYNGKLTKIEFTECTLGFHGADQFARALGECSSHTQSLRCVRLDDNELTFRGLKLIIGALSRLENIEALTVSDNNVGREGCRALGRYLTFASGKLKDLNLSYNRIDDVGLVSLVDGLGATTMDGRGGVFNCALKQLCLTGNSSISSVGLQAVTSLMTMPTCNLKQLWLYHMNIGDEGASVLADGLVKNKSIRKLWFNPATCGITSKGWNRFASMLCDSTTINNIYLSNHTIELIGKHYTNYAESEDQIPDVIKSCLYFHNHRQKIMSTKSIAYCKIMVHNDDIKMDPLFEWNLKFLPMMVTWFANVYKEWEMPVVQRTKLFCIFQFVRGMPFYFGNHSGLAVQAREKARLSTTRKRGRGRYHVCSVFASLDREQPKKMRGGPARVFAIGDSVKVDMQVFAIGDSVKVDDSSVAVVKNVTLKGKGWKPVYEVQFANGQVWGVGADALS
eukprot:CAMPEP_0201730436 /NCGR_PEP_ID=MMETSP0593-20130828/22184_1 /ASSEMBLY_ACC=CAM_ASM_000672 /TAXON_ID=267983 /ORGANISM="Skeletonema japonicum, Strain CCMP2506" /LENGTH=720 /DNA_ID=CAMNT_0048222987 /DNA_START=154 /DNA_END=2312 /DNA_ORIENTATION=-